MKSKKKVKKIIIVIISVICFIILFSLLFNCIFLSPFIYYNNTRISSDANQAIKELVLNSFKDLFLINGFYNSEDLYYSTNEEDIIQLDKNSDISKNSFFIIQRDFMKNLEINEKDEYYLIVKTYFPESYFCHINIIKTEKGYKITSFGLDI